MSDNNIVTKETYTFDVEEKRKQRGKNGRFIHGYTPWNKGKTWDEMNLSKEKQALMKSKLSHCGNPKGHVIYERPVIQYDINGERLHWYRSSVEAERKTGINSSGIRNACYGKYKTYKGYVWKHDERFIK